MNTKRLLALSKEDQDKYIRGELESKKRLELVHLASEYGLSPRNMGRNEIIDTLTEFLLEWIKTIN